MRSELDARVEELESQLREERKRFEAPTTRYDSKNRTNIANAEDIKHELQRKLIKFIRFSVESVKYCSLFSYPCVRVLITIHLIQSMVFSSFF